MVGKYDIIVQDEFIRYEFTIDRKVSVIKGDSSTGKTTLYDDIVVLCESDDSEVAVNCNMSDRVRALNRDNYERLMKETDKIIFIEENFRLLGSKAFSRLLNSSDNYFVIISRKLIDKGLT